MPCIPTTDVAVPLSKLSLIIQETKDQIKVSGLLGSTVGHVGDGKFHTLLFFSEEDRDKVEKLVRWMVDRVIELEGTCTGEHGVGLVKRDYLSEELGRPLSTP